MKLSTKPSLASDCTYISYYRHIRHALIFKLFFVLSFKLGKLLR
ncbi:MAG TPA: hypothetical protein VGB32_13460 [Candidatus Bathyarchaeia archaeon]